MGSGDQGIRGTVGTEDQLNSGNSRPEEQWTRGPEDQRNSGHSGHRGPEKQYAQRSSRTVGTKDQRNSEHRGPMKQWVQRIRGTVST